MSRELCARATTDDCQTPTPRDAAPVLTNHPPEVNHAQ